MQVQAPGISIYAKPWSNCRWAFLVDMNGVRVGQSKFFIISSFLILSMACGTKPPASALAEFYVHDGAEDQLMDPLILAGDKVVPLVIERVKDKDMPRRRYAIAFLGNGSYRQALPVLQQILQDSTEADYYRGDALQSIYQIDPRLGTTYAQNYQTGIDYVGSIAKGIIAGDRSLKKRRSYWEAWWARHD